MDNKNNNRLKTLLCAIDEVNRENQINLKIASPGGATPVSFGGATPLIDIKNQSRYSYDYLKFDTLTSACTIAMRIKEDII